MTLDQLLADCRVPVLGICAFSGTGKTTLLKKLLPNLAGRNLKVAVLKHAHHNFEVDKPGKDSFEIRKSGADQILIASSQRRALMMERPVEGDPSLKELLGMIDQDRVDLILVEGFKRLPLPKLELHRAELGKPFVFESDNLIQAIACDNATELPAEANLKRIDINAVDDIADYIQSFMAQWQPVGNQPFGPSCDSFERKQLSVKQGIERILAMVNPLTETETVPLTQSINRVLAEPAVSPINVPQHTNSAMDGYACNFDTDIASYQVMDTVFAGHAYQGELQPGEAVKIMTGAPMPQGADTVIMRELATETDANVRFEDGVVTGQHVRQAGEDIAVGEQALPAGERITPAAVGLLASLGLANPVVYRRPTIAIFSTGDEVCSPDEPLKPNCIYDSNRYSLHGLLTKLDCDILDLGVIEDNQAAMEQALLNAAAKADIVLTSGGVSVGDADFIKDALEQTGEINFWKIAQRPGRPLAFGTINGTLFFGLPGNPVATVVSFLQFVQPTIRKMAGESDWQPRLLRATSATPLRSRIGRTEFIRGIMQIGAGGQLEVSSTGAQGSGMLSSMTEANCLIVIEEPQEHVAVGDTVWVQPFSDLL
ncbi:bifunctional molybdopterin-guanine dinucleotide biosynthesis adaptor protein MobB/molybdopterin molybdotransferase MoeA [Ferrimonas lipolytica]|uniref:Molybdopterin molybdenumtransferase n=1 Tax=Ferrimonas lipolytica TaxID=2724191 RepID=A0A6H1UFY7_9GAMM|nr:bifunctional molybdopterin-guanine dinucleotide biosynthesis adaptor protein MobB/molybdopterin molybdotransferase MoeA [Ferrimonas lipolytica]QIZ78017.1 bifunctional molybdopterin-guanine dinucleotide biosynthesis adaptor protein MobB/molybdopterin molybdotransferase MoeA [Ferrimonas lipolytica]